MLPAKFEIGITGMEVGDSQVMTRLRRFRKIYPTSFSLDHMQFRKPECIDI
jgi:hypothetical protein